MFKVTEIFYSIQGEGSTQGAPSVFVRLWGCNFSVYGGCSFCDSRYSWDSGAQDAKVYSKEELVAAILSATGATDIHNVDVVFTGGEPLLYVNDDFIYVLNVLRLRVNSIYFETNGTINLKKFRKTLEFVKFNCSPKTSNSGIPKSARYKPEVLQEIADVSGSCFKFVITSEEDIKEIFEIVEDAELPISKCYLMPEGTTIDAINKHMLTCVKYSKLYGFRVSNRLQIQMFNNKRGV